MESVAVLFTNYSTEDFTHKWDNVSYTFSAGQSQMLQSHLAQHFAKHLATRELNKIDKNTGGGALKEEMKKALDAESVVKAENDIKLQMEVTNFNSMKKPDLVKAAEEKGIEVKGKKKDELVEELEGMNE